MERVEIALGNNYFLVKEPTCLWIERRTKRKSKRDATKDVDSTDRVTGYVTSYTQVLQSALEHDVLSGMAEKPKDALQELADAETRLKEWAETIGKELDKPRGKLKRK